MPSAVCVICFLCACPVFITVCATSQSASRRLYEREFLLGLRKTVAGAPSLHLDDQKSCNPPFLACASADMCGLMDYFRYRRKRSRKRGKRGGVLVMQRITRARAFAVALDGHANLVVSDVGPAFLLTTIFRNCFKCTPVSATNFVSFEVQVFKVDLTRSVTFALLNRPPKYNKDFIQEFSEFLSSMSTCCDSLVILGDFNIHVALIGP